LLAQRLAWCGLGCLAPEAAAAAEADACSEQPATSNQQAGSDWLALRIPNLLSVEIQTGMIPSQMLSRLRAIFY
jgi:hypothetical protein